MRSAIVCMPFASMRRPSLQIGLLAAIARSHGLPCDTWHLNLDFAFRMDAAFYEVLCQFRGQLIGDWLFSLEAFGGAAPDQADGFSDDFRVSLDALRPNGGDIGAELRHLRRVTVPAFLAHASAAVDWSSYDVIGFTSTFQQHVAALAMARRIRALAPAAWIVFGGANLEGAMGVETARCFDVVDYVVSGEGDFAWPSLLKAFQSGTDPLEIAGVIGRENGCIRRGPAPRPFNNLDANPPPDYAEYFRRAEELGLLSHAGRREVQIPFESSRGCWWGEKSHCTFCGLNGSTMHYRSKTPARVVQELQTLARETRSFDFEAVDNILDRQYFDKLFSELTRKNLDFTFFYEVKANLDRHLIAGLKAGGVTRIQPGIESLSTRILKLMRKGATAIQNVNLLRWATYYGIGVSWNMLWGFPGEEPDDYRSQRALITRLAHLQPPEACGPVWMERFSPMFTDQQHFKRVFMRPAPSYAYVYPASTSLDDIAYFFDYALEGTLAADAFVDLAEVIGSWQTAWRSETKPALNFRSAGDLIQIYDERRPGEEGVFTFEGPLAHAYLACVDDPVFDSKVAAVIGAPYPIAEIRSALSRFCDLGLMMRDGDRYLALALPATRGRYLQYASETAKCASSKSRN